MLSEGSLQLLNEKINIPAPKLLRKAGNYKGHESTRKQHSNYVKTVFFDISDTFRYQCLRFRELTLSLNSICIFLPYVFANTVELQWLEHLWDHEN